MKEGQTSKRAGIEDILIPMYNFNCTQGDFEGNHPSYACDMAGKDTGREIAYFPFSAICMAINADDGNAVWWQSQDKVRFADGTIDYCTIMVLHDNSLDGIKVGAKYPQGHQMAVEGNKMGTTYGQIGNHLHFEIAKGKFTKQYAHNNKGYYLPNGMAIEKACFADGTNFIGNSKTWKWKYLKDVPVNTCPYKSKGAIKALYDGIRVRTTPSLSKGDTGITYNTNSSVLYYNRIVEAEGWYWAEYDRANGGHGYVGLCKLDGTNKYWKQV